MELEMGKACGLCDAEGREEGQLTEPVMLYAVIF